MLMKQKGISNNHHGHSITTHIISPLSIATQQKISITYTAVSPLLLLLLFPFIFRGVLCVGKNPITINYIIIYAVILLTCVTNLWLTIQTMRMYVLQKWYQIEIKDPSRKRFSFMSLRNDKFRPFQKCKNFLATWLIVKIPSYVFSCVFYLCLWIFSMHKKFAAFCRIHSFFLRSEYFFWHP